MIHIHNSNLLCMHHMFMEWHKKFNFNLTVNSFFENSKSAVFYLRRKLYQKIFRFVSNGNIYLFCMLEKLKFVFNENTDLFWPEKILNLYLLKIQICYVTRKIFRPVFNENTDLFFTRKNLRSVFNENIDLFLVVFLEQESFND